MKKLFLLPITALFLCIGLCSQQSYAQTNLLVDGGFEFGLPPGGASQSPTYGAWTANNASQTLLLGMPFSMLPSLEGNNAMHIGENRLPGSVRQTFATTIGVNYEVSFWAIGWNNEPGSGTIRVFNGGATDLVSPFSLPGGNNWSQRQFQFTATGTSTILELQNVPSAATTIDDVSVTLIAAVDADNDGYTDDVDCDDSNAAINPGATEIFDGIDNDCDSLIDCDDPSYIDNEAPDNTIGFELLPESTIISGTEQELLASWVPANLQYEANLLFTKTVDGSTSQDFHNLCDGIPNTLVVVRTTDGYVFGGYNEGVWNGSQNSYVPNLTNNFLFSVNNQTKHVPGGSTTNPYNYSIYNLSNYGPTFGGGHDLNINQTLSGGYSNLGHSYECVNGTSGSNECRANLAGSYNGWQIEELEVWELRSTGNALGDGIVITDVEAQCEVISIDAPIAIDNCAGEITGTTNTAFPITTQGLTEVIWTFDDGNGNTSSIIQNVIIEDTENPIAICQNITLTLDENGQATLTAEQVDDGSSDNCGPVTLSIDRTSFSCDDAGSNSTAITPAFIGTQTQPTQSYGGGFNPNTNEFWYPLWSGQTVYRSDSDHNSLGTFNSGQPQMMQLWMDTDSETDYYTANWNYATITKRSGNSTVWSTNMGTTAAAVTTDADYVYALLWNSNQIRVLDKTDGTFIRTISLPGIMLSYGGLVYANGNLYIGGQANGWSSIPNTYAAIHTVEATDGTFISSTSTSVSITSMAFDGETMWVSNNTNTIYGYQIAEGSAYGANSIDVVLTVTDSNNNVSTCTASVSVIDTSAPTIACPANITQNVDAGVCGATVTYAVTTTDNCTINIEQTEGLASGEIFPVGLTTNTFIVTDAAGNTATCSFDVTIIDNEDPTITCPTNITVNNDEGLCSAVVNYEVTPADNCASSGASTLTEVLTAVNSDFETIAELIPNRFNFVYDIWGNNNIFNGGPDMYDNGNFLNTNLASQIQYSDNAITNSNAFGTGSQYFTRNLPGLFVMAADINALTQFRISGNLGADGGGSTFGSVQTLTKGATTYTAFIKEVVTPVNDPSVNHMIIVENNPSASHTYSNNTDNDNHVVNGLASSTRIYYLLYAGRLGSSGFNIPDADHLAIFDAFTDLLDGGIELTQTAGIVSGEEFPVGTTTNTFVTTDTSGNTATCSFDVTVVDNEAPVVASELLPNSTIISGTDQGLITSWLPANLQNEANLLFTKTVDGSTASAFHSLCDGIPNTLVVVKTTDGYIFGGYNEGVWSTNTGYVNNLPNNFLFSVNNQTKHDYHNLYYGGNNAIYNRPDYGPTFGGGHDLYINNNLSGGYSNLGYSYDCVTGTAGSSDCRNNLAGSYNSWQIEELEVWELSSTGNQVGGGVPDIIAQCEVTALEPIIANDNCNGEITGISDANLPITDQGTTVVTWTFDDGNGNITTETQNVIIEDTEPPVLTCPDEQTVVLDNTCNAEMPDYTDGVATDNCSVTVTQSPIAGTTYDGDQDVVVTLTADDGHGNVVDCTFNVHFDDITLPFLTCPTDQIVVLNNTCDALMPDYSVDIATDNCGVTVTQSPVAGLVYNGDQNITVTLTADDGNGNVVDCSFNVHFEDQTPPTLVCPSDIEAIATSAAGVTVTFTAPTGTDNCGVASTNLITNLDSGDTFPIGNTTVIYEVTDAANNTGQCSFTVTVSGLLPEIICPIDITQNNDIGQCGSNVSFTATETVGIPASTITYSQDPGTVFPVGTTTVTATATNPVGTSECTFTVTVTDDEIPVINGTPANISVSNDSGSCDAIVNWTPATVTDNCPGATISSDYNSGGTFPVGTTTVTYTASDANGNDAESTAFTVTVNDTEDLTIACEPTVNINNDPGECFGTATLTPPTVTDICPDNALNFDGTNDYVNAGLIDLTNTHYTFEGWFNSNSSGEDLFNVYNNSITNGQFSLIEIQNTTGYLRYLHRPTGSSSGTGDNLFTTFPVNDGLWHHFAAVYDTDNYIRLYVDGVLVDTSAGTLSDLSGGTTGVEIGRLNYGSGSRYFSGSLDEIRVWNTARTQAEIQANMNTELNTTPGLVATYHFNEGIANGNNAGVTTAADATGNGNDGTLNNFALTGDTSNWVGQSTVEATWNGNPVTDNTQFDLGPNTVTWTATDAAGNTVSCDQLVTVTDDEIPVVNGTPANITQINDSGVCDAKVFWTPATVSDNCPGATISSDYNSGDTFPLGTTTVTYTASDANGNDAVVTSFNVTVTDDEDPTITCAAAQSQTADAGQCDAAVIVTPPSFTDNCTTATITNDFNGTADASGTYPLGATTVTWTVDDGNGQTATCTQVITVTDDENPTIACAANVSASTDTGLCTADLSIAPPTVGDNCEQTSSGSTNNALNFNGSSDWILVDNPSNFNLGTATGFTFQATVKTTKATATIFSNMELSSLPLGYQIWIINGDLLLELYGTPNITTSGLNLNDGQCHHIAVVVDKLAANAKLYVDGALALDVNNPGYAINLDNSAPVYLGQERTQNPSLRYLGDLDEVAFFNVARTGSDILESSQTQLSGSETGLVSYWKLDEGAANGNNGGIISATDSSGGNNGTLIGFGLSGSNSNWVSSTCELATNSTSNVTLTNDFNNTADASGSYPIGTTTVTWTATDAAGNTAECTQTVTVTDNEIPVINDTSANISVSNDSGSCDASVNWTPATVSDNCPGATISSDYNSGDTFPLGTTTVTYTASDANGNDAEVTSFTVTVTDDEDPTITCAAAQSQTADAGQCDAAVIVTPPSFTDNCTTATITNDFNGTADASGTYPLGATTVTWTVDDGNGQTATCTQVITVTDDEIPVINGTPANISVSNDSGSCDAKVFWTPATVSDNCPGATISSDYNSGDTFPLGTTTVTYTASDANGNDAEVTSFTVTVTDDEDPTITCAAAQSQTADAGQCDAAVTVTAPSFTDNCTTAIITNDFNGTADASGTYPLGATTVIWTVDDGNGQTASCTQVITVTDDEIPVIDGTPANISVSNDPGTCDAKVFWTPATVSDNCPGATISSDYNSGDTFPLGTTTVTYTASDANGNDAVVTSFTVTVTDDEDPTITCAAAQSQTADAGQCDAALTVTPPSFTDNCTTATITNDFNGTADASGTYPLGATTVTWTVDDGNGQTATCTQVITVTDDEVPVINGTPANISVSNDSGSCDAIVNWTPATVSDNCPGVTISSDYNSGDTFPLGTTTVTYTASDANGNNAEVTSFTVTVTDDEDPIITCAAAQSQTADAGQCDATVTVTAPSFTDNCTTAIITNDFNGTSDASGTYPLGDTTVIWTVDDGNGQTATCTQVITVTDDEIPVINGTPANISVSNNSGSCDAIVNWTPATVSDNCPGATISSDYNSGDTFPVGTTTVTYIASDAAGNNAVSTSLTVTVEDDEAPIIDCVNLSIVLNDEGTGVIDEVAFIAANGSTDNCGIDSIVLSETAFSCADIGGDLDELIISEYVDGTGNNDWIEIYNGTGNTIILGDVVNGGLVSYYSINIYTDGSTTPTTIGLLGSIGDRQVYKISHTDAPNISGNPTNNFGSPLMVFDGNDAIALSNNGVAVDVIGEIGVNPGSGWSSTSNATNATTLVRQSTIQQGNVSSFVANFETEWIAFAQNDVSNLGGHTIEISDNANNVILTVTDIHGNVATCEGSVTVVDATLPIALCQNVVVQLDANGNGSTTAQAVDNGSNDACGIASLALSQTQFTCADIGANPVTLTVTDSNGNESTCTATVTVLDEVGPAVVCNPITVQLDSFGNYALTDYTGQGTSDVDAIGAGSTDACGIATMTVSPNSFTCADVNSPVTVTLTVTDINNNVSTCQTTVTVEDNVDPEALCQPVTVQLDANGEASIEVNAIDNGSNDACGIASRTLDITEFTCTDVGAPVTVVLTVTDNNGNTSTCESLVTVLGDIPTVTINDPEELPEFCQGAVLVLTTTATDAASYLWSPGGETTESIEVGPQGGTFTVTVTSATNCSVSDTFTVAAFDESTLLSAYTILAEEEVFLHGSNLVQSGGIGATDANGLIKLHQATNVIEFGRAANIVLNQGSTIVTPIYQPAEIPFPDFVFNDQSNNASPDVTINTNQSTILNGSVYGTITVKQGATVTFSQSDIYIDELRTFDGAAIEFSGCANVFINTKFMLAQNGTINANGNNVVMYVNEDVQIEKGSYVRARIHSNGNELLAKGPNGNANNSGDLTQMIGLFIAKKVHGNKNVVWNADDLCAPCPISPTNAPIIGNVNDFGVDAFDVLTWPNPSDTEFYVQLKTLDLYSESYIEVFDISNKLVFTGTFKPQEVYAFGKQLEGGVYIVKVQQGQNSKTIRLVKY